MIPDPAIRAAKTSNLYSEVKIINSPTNPFVKGTPMLPNIMTMYNPAKTGIYCRNPPKQLMSKFPFNLNNI
jgi:hypothetical protein